MGKLFERFALVITLSLPLSQAFAQLPPAVVVTDLSYISPGKRVDIGGRMMNVHCIGQGSPTVLFEAGLGDQIRAWATVQPEVAKKTRACSYDRAGYGFSDPSSRPATSANIVDDLHRLLNAALIKPPYILVGHSAGGMYLRLYADRYLAEVAGMVLVDPVSEEQGQRFYELDPATRYLNQSYVESIRDECLPTAANGWERNSQLYKKCVGEPNPNFSGAFNEAYLANHARPEYFRTVVSEWMNIFTTSSDQVRAEKKSYGGMPFIILTRAPFPRSQNETQEMRDAKNHLWVVLHDELACLSNRGVNRVISGAGHFIQFDNPKVVIDAIEQVMKDLSPGGATRNTTEATLPSHEQALGLFDRLVQDIERLDGDGLTVRNTRPESWKQTIARLRLAVAAATTPAEFGHVFDRLRATYPNFHAGVNLADGFRAKWMPGGATLPVTFRPDILKPDEPRPAIRVSNVNQAWAKAQPAGTMLPEPGDIVSAINSRPIADWLRENEIFCRYPLAGQCPMEFQRNLVRGFLFWNPETPLHVELQRGGEKVDVTLFAEPAAVPAKSAPTSSQLVVPPPTTQANAAPVCAAAHPRMPDGYVLTWAGTMVCVFENPEQPGTQIWRIETFAAERSRVKDAAPGQFKSVAEETDAFYDKFWKSRAASVKHLVIDVAGNSGGESVVRWHQLLFPERFQMPFVQYKKIREFDQPKVRKALFWGSDESQRFLDALKRDGAFAKISEGGWLPPRQMFCPDDTGDCEDAYHVPRAHGFRGRVSLVIDQFCNSACVTFAWNVKDKMGARVVGLPDDADTAFSRLVIHFGFAADGAIVTSVEDASGIAKPVGSFIVAATRSTDANGKLISAKPLMPGRVVFRAWQQNGDEWAREAISAALRP